MGRLRAIPVILLFTAAALAGCVGDDGAGQQVDDPPTKATTDPAPTASPGSLPRTADEPRTVVAVIDTGANPYHEWFQRGTSLPDDVLAQFANSLDGQTPKRVSLSHTGDHTERVEADAETWKGLKHGTLYYFEGTNLLGISFDEGDSNAHVVLDDAGHGSGTTGAVVAANPDAIVVLIEGISADSEAWAATQSWIDLISMSYGPVGSIPGSGSIFGLTTHEATRLAWTNGKIPVGAADNTPALAPNDETAGPPWVVGVGGDHEDTKCRDHVSGTFPDVTSDFTQTLPRHDDTTELRTMSGTSFATPKTAGLYSNVLLRVRQAWDHSGSGASDGLLAAGPDGASLTHGALRDAMNRTAYYFDFAECEAEPGSSLPVNPAAPWLQMGWGHVGDAGVQPAVDHILGAKQAPERDAGAVSFQTALHAYRQALWENI